MDVISYEYTKQRREFGLHPQFTDAVTCNDTILSNDDDSKQWITSISTTVELDCIPDMAQHEVNTERFVQQHKAISHQEGAWPLEIKTNEWTDRQRYLRRVINEPNFQPTIQHLTKIAESCVLQNNTIDLFEDYYDDEEYELPFVVQPHSVKTLAVFRDPNKNKRSANKLSWHPDGNHKIAVSYSVMQFQQMSAATATDQDKLSYIWDVNNPNTPDAKLLPQSPLCCIAYNPRSGDHLVGGSYNGVINFFDLRKGSTPVETSLLEQSHHDPVYDVAWIQSRTGNECVSTSTDGQLLWWDIRKLKQGPVDSMILSGEGDIVYGGTSLEYKSDAGATRYLIGTEQGVTILVDRKAKKDSESQKQIKATFGYQNGGHHGPVYGIQRNPYNPKFFLSVADWSSRVWMEDLKSPIIVTKYENSYVTNACWSTTRPGVYFTTKSDGTMHAWDLYHKHNDPVFSTKVSDSSLQSIKVHNNGKHIAVGTADGTVTILRVSKGLSEVQKDEKSMISTMLDRETRREKNLEIRSMQKKRDNTNKRGSVSMSATQQLQLQQQLASTGSLEEKKDSNEPFPEEDKETLEAIRKAEEEFFVAMQAAQDAANKASTDNNDEKEQAAATGDSDE